MHASIRALQAAALCSCVLALIALAHPAAAQDTPPAPVVSYHFSLVDHFSAADPSGAAPLRFQQKILTCAKFWRNGTGPVLFYTGNEGPIDGFYANTGAAFEWGAKLGALLVFVEHRFYGESLPFGADSFTPANLRFLNIAQALEDFAVIIDAQKTQLGLQGANAVPWVALGGSYGGVLSAWMRSKYPALISGAIAASAPIRYIGSQEDYSFFAGATSDYAAVGSQCVSAVRAGFAQLQKLRDQGNYAEIQAQLRLCDTPTAATIEHVFLWATNSLLSLAQYDYPYPTNFDAPLPGYPVTAACAILADSTPANALALLGQAVGLFFNGTASASASASDSDSDSLSCFDPASEFIECADQTGCGLGSDGTAWDYQVCTQFVYLPSTNGKSDMFPPREFTMAELAEYCSGKYGVAPDPDVLRIEFGGDAILNTASNIVFSNGRLDPYHNGGFLPSASASAAGAVRSPVPGLQVQQLFHAEGAQPAASITLLLIEKAAHHLDLRFSNPLDDPAVTHAREIELQQIQLWIQQFEAQKQKQTQQRSGPVHARRQPVPRVASE